MDIGTPTRIKQFCVTWTASRLNAKSGAYKNMSKYPGNVTITKHILSGAMKEGIEE